MRDGSNPLDGHDPSIGFVAGPVVGLKYETPTGSGATDERGAFTYRSGETVTFLVGGLVLGTCPAAPQVNLAQLVNRVAGNIDKLHDPSATNLARFVLSLDESGSIEGGVTIAPAAHDMVRPVPINFNQPEGGFASDPIVAALLQQLGAKSLCDAATARNELRRNIRGIGPFRERLDALLAENEARPRRDRLRMTRIHDLLLREGFEGSYDAVRRYAARWSEARRKPDQIGYGDCIGQGASRNLTRGDRVTRPLAKCDLALTKLCAVLHKSLHMLRRVRN